MPLFRVLRAFLARFWAFRVGLCCLRALLGLCGFCTRVELGGLKACCVFAPIFIVLPLVLSFCPAFLLSVFLPLFILFACLVCSCVLVAFVVVSFSLSDYTQKERAQVLCVLSCPVVGLLCEIGLSVLVKFVFVSLDCFGYAFIRGAVFVIVLPLLEKTFENTINKFPCVNLVFYALFYVI